MIPMSNWKGCKKEISRKQAIVTRKVVSLRRQQLAQQNAQARYYGDGYRS